MSVQTDIKLSFDARFEITPVRWWWGGGESTQYSVFNLGTFATVIILSIEFKIILSL